MKKVIAILFLIYGIDSLSQSSKKIDDDAIYNLAGIEVRPEFPEGMEKLNAYISESLSKAGFATPAKTKVKTKSEAISMFVIEKDGSLSDIKIYGKISPLKSEEFTRILKSLPNWNPGKQNGTIVRVMYVLPIPN